METSDIILYGGIGLAVWYFLSQPSATTAATTTTPAATSTTATPAAPTNAQVELAFLQAMGSAPILAAAKPALPASAMLTGYQWNYYLTQVSGIAPPAGTGGSTPITLSAWWASVIAGATTAANNSVIQQAATASGLAGLAGLGATRQRQTLRQHSQTRQAGQQPGHGAVRPGTFPTPGTNVDGRYDFDDLGWA